VDLGDLMTKNSEIYGVSKDDDDDNEYNNSKVVPMGMFLLDRRDDSGKSQEDFVKELGFTNHRFFLVATGQSYPTTLEVLNIMEKFHLGIPRTRELLEYKI